jgi:hypothetical protein
LVDNAGSADRDRGRGVLPDQFVPAPFDVSSPVLPVVFQVTLLLAYLRLVGTQPVDQSTVRHPPPIPAPAV